MEGYEHLLAHLLPGLNFVVCEPDPGAQRTAAPRGQDLQHLPDGVGDPGHHHVGVRVIAQPLLVRSGVLLMEFVGAHDAVDLVATALRVEVSGAGPKARDLEHHLRAVLLQELGIRGRLIVVPDVVEDGCVDVALVVAEVGVPQSRSRVEMYHLGLFLPVATALPGIHRPLVAGLRGQRSSLVQPSVPIAEQPTRDVGQPKVEERVDVELVPEDVPAIGFAVEAAGGDARVQLGCMRRASLKDVRDVEAKQELNPLRSWNPDVAFGPEIVPGSRVTLEGVGERPVTRDRLLRAA